MRQDKLLAVKQILIYFESLKVLRVFVGLRSTQMCTNCFVTCYLNTNILVRYNSKYYVNMFWLFCIFYQIYFTFLFV